MARSARDAVPPAPPAGLQTPAAALFESAIGTAVYVIEDGLAHRCDVRTGRGRGAWQPVGLGLIYYGGSEAVVLQPSRAISDGTRVAPLSPG